MSSTIKNQATLSRAEALVFARETPAVAAERNVSLLENFRSWRERRAAEAELNALSDRNLADIGLRREDIPRVVRG
jgi:uncharacterized protein YjiS (DUF1127 family)